MASARVKAEPPVKQELEDAGASPAALSDNDDLYEDAGDLEFYDSALPNNPYDKIYLTHVPKYLYDAWAHLDDDSEIEIGTVRQWTETLPDGRSKQRLAMLLSPQAPAHQNIPREYNLEVKDMNLLNTFLFTEQDLPGYKTKSQGPNSGLPPHLRPKLDRSRDKNNAEGGRKNRYQPYYRKAIPKKTTLAGRCRHELNCHPADTPETKHILSMRASDALKPKATTSIASDPRGIASGVSRVGAMGANDKFGNFVRAPVDVKKTKKKNEDRAARLDQSALRDRIFACYDRYRYWSTKALKQELSQPEAWLRENLDQLAVLHKTGPFANHWELREEYKRNKIQDLQEIAPDNGPDADESDSDADDDEVQMEDVV